MKFSEVIGQENAKKLLSLAVKNDVISHAYILSGEEGSGKMMLAEAFAAALMCERQDGEACGQCDCCKQTMNRNNPDVIYVTHEKPTIISIEEIRDQVNNAVVVKPYKAKHKLFIVDDAQLIQEKGQNALLKTIEEPPEYATIMLLTTNANAFLPTILSRCIQIEMKPVKDELIKEHLMMKHDVVDYQADICTAFAQGNVGKAISLAFDVEFSERKDRLIDFLIHIKSYGLYEISNFIKEMSEDKIIVEETLSLITLWMKDVLLYKTVGQRDRLIFKKEADKIIKMAEKYSYEGINNVVSSVDEARDRLRYNVSFENTMELLFYNIKENTNA